MDEQVPLAPLTTLELGGPARYLARVESTVELVEALRWAREERIAVAVLGGGSNLVVADAGFDGLVVQPALRGVELDRGADRVRVTVAAGEPWDEVVALAVGEGLAGLECLSGIPGTAGAAPIQNIGAYGQELSGVMESVQVLDCESLRERTLCGAECGFGYRSSRFRAEPGRSVVLAVTLALGAGARPALRYPELAEALAVRAAEPSLSDVRAAVLELRRGKSMVLDPDDPNRRSAGSFFSNPVLDPAAAEAVVARALASGAVVRAEEVPRFPAAGGAVKIPAAWLIERAGFEKGLRRGPVGISTRHALALVHHGGGTTRELLTLAAEIRTAVRDRFDVILQPEPVLLGFPPGDPLAPFSTAAESCRKAYAEGEGLGDEYAGWEEQGEWPDE